MKLFPLSWAFYVFVGIVSILYCLGIDEILPNVTNSVARVLLDTSCHAILSLSQFVMFAIIRKSQIFKIYRHMIFSLVMGSVIDIDHFIAAGSMSLYDATHLSFRPWGHCIICGVLVLGTICFIGDVSTIVYVQVFLGYFSHILRDSLRRGLWIIFSVSSPPVPLYIFAFCILVIPKVMNDLFPSCSSEFSFHSSSKELAPVGQYLV